MLESNLILYTLVLREKNKYTEFFLCSLTVDCYNQLFIQKNKKTKKKVKRLKKDKNEAILYKV